MNKITLKVVNKFFDLIQIDIKSLPGKSFEIYRFNSDNKPDYDFHVSYDDGYIIDIFDSNKKNPDDAYVTSITAYSFGETINEILDWT